MFLFLCLVESVNILFRNFALISYHLRMKKFFAPIFSLLVGCSSAFATGFSLTSSESSSYNDIYINGTVGQLSVFLVNSTENGATLNFSCETQDSLYQMKWYSYTEDVDHLTEISSGVVTKAATSSLSDFKTNCGYAVEYADKEGNKSTYYVWLTKFLPITSATVDTSEYHCDQLPIHIAPVMTYRTIYGNVNTVKRTEEVSYSVFEMEKEKTIDSKTEELSGDSIIYIPSVPTVDTRFDFVNTLFGSTFTTDTFVTYAVNAFPFMIADTAYVTEMDEKDVLKNKDGRVIVYFGEPDNFRSSSPFSIDFKSNCSPKVDEFVWYFGKDETFKGARQYPIKSWKDSIINYKGLNSLGKHCIKYEASNSKSGCTYSSYACFTVVGSELYVPNVFTPNSNTNKLFRVSYSSIKSFECRIYNQWGRKVFETDNIKEGWDGTFNGRELPTGVYFVVINAEGYDGQEHHKKVTLSLIRTED